MSSFGGESPINVVNVYLEGNSNVQYTVPAGRYFKGRVMGEGDSSGNTVFQINSQDVFTVANGASINEEIILSAGTTFGTNSGNGTDQAYLIGLEYNNP
jgi:hypothetical protein